jgi:hypothetical protein
MANRVIELSVTWVDRSDPFQASGRTMGMLRWDADNPTAEPEELSSVDAQTVELMRAYVEDHDARLAKMREGLAKRQRG